MRYLYILFTALCLYGCSGNLSSDFECDAVTEALIQEHKRANILSQPLMVCFEEGLPELDKSTIESFRKVKRVIPSPPARPFNTGMLLRKHISEMVSKDILTLADSVYLIETTKALCGQQPEGTYISCLGEKLSATSSEAKVVDEPVGEYIKISAPVFNQNQTVMLLFMDKAEKGQRDATGELEAYMKYQGQWKLVWTMTRWME